MVATVDEASSSETNETFTLPAAATDDSMSLDHAGLNARRSPAAAATASAAGWKRRLMAKHMLATAMTHGAREVNAEGDVVAARAEGGWRRGARMSMTASAGGALRERSIASLIFLLGARLWWGRTLP